MDTADIIKPSAGDLHKRVQMWLAAGIPLIIPGQMFRSRIAPMGSTHFYDEIKSGRLQAVKHAGRACVEIEEAARYISKLPKMANEAA